MRLQRDAKEEGSWRGCRGNREGGRKRRFVGEEVGRAGTPGNASAVWARVGMNPVLEIQQNAQDGGAHLRRAVPRPATRRRVHQQKANDVLKMSTINWSTIEKNPAWSNEGVLVTDGLGWANL